LRGPHGAGVSKRPGWIGARLSQSRPRAHPLTAQVGRSAAFVEAGTAHLAAAKRSRKRGARCAALFIALLVAFGAAVGIWAAIRFA
jgi:hypothetical protein